MLIKNHGNAHVLCLSMVLGFSTAPVAWAGATYDGLLGGTGTGTLTGNFTIPDTDGVTSGTNLFHSFSDFNINAGESATFTGPGSINNVLTRVTGTGTSTFDGPLNSAIPSANFYFINPNGVIFKEGAQITVNGSFYATTSNYIVDQKGDKFFADGARSELISSPPAAFGFLDSNPGQITLEGTQLLKGFNLIQPDGATFSLVGGDISLDQAPEGTVTQYGTPDSRGSFISLTGNRFEIVSVASSGEAIIVNDGYDLSSFNTLGDVAIIGGSVIDATDVYIRAGNVVIQDSVIAPGFFYLPYFYSMLSNQFGLNILGGPFPAPAGNSINAAPAGGSIDIGATTQLTISGTGPLQIQAIFPGFEFMGPLALPRPNFESYLSGITAYGGNPTYFAGTPSTDVADININGGNILVSGAAGIISERYGTGLAGDINITGGILEVRNGAFIANVNTFIGAGGNINVNTEQVILDGESNTTGPTGLIASSTFGVLHGAFFDPLFFGMEVTNGDAGTITVNATGPGGLSVHGGASISTESRAFGQAGDIIINASDIDLSRDGMAFGAIASQSAYAGDAGDITVHATGDINIQDGFEITGSIEGTGTGGSVSVTADNTINISGDGSGIASATLEPSSEVKDELAQRFGSADFDSMIVDLNNFAGGPLLQPDATLFDALGALQLLGLVNLNDPNPSAGNAGPITVNASTLNMDGASRITSSTSDDGNGGIINIQVENMAMTNGAEIRSRSGLNNEITGNLEIGAGNGGDINVIASNAISMASGSSISVSSLGDGMAGNISIDAGNVLDMSDSSMTSQAEGSGDGGNISVTASDAVTMQNSSSISASSLGSGFAGNVAIDAGNTFEMSGSSITTQAKTSDGGNIQIQAEKLIYLDQSEVTTSVESGTGGGGNIDIDPDFVILKQSNILANAFGGPGGNINIVAGNFIATPDSVVDASSALGIDGTVNISSPDETVSEDLAVLPKNYLDVTSLMSDRCGTTAGASSLVDAGPGGRAVDPDGYLPSFAANTQNNNEEKNGDKTVSNGKRWWASYANQPALQLAQTTCTF